MTRSAFAPLLMRALATVCVCAGMGTGCSSRPDAAAAAPTNTSAGDGSFAAAESSAVALPLLLPAQLYVEHDAVIAVRTGGVLKTLSADLGMTVRSGQELGRVDDDAQRLAQSRATVLLDRAKQVAWRAKEMRAGNNIPQSEAEDAEFALREAEVNKREADLALERTALVAPFDGVVTGRFVQPGRLMTLNDSVVRITARGPYLARLRLPEQVTGALRSGAAVQVRVADGVKTRGTVVRLSPAIDAASGTREAIVRVDAGNGMLMPGLAVSIEVSRQSRRGLTVPATAVSSDGYVVVQQNGRNVMRPVIVGDTVGDRVEIRAGLSIGERVRTTAARSGSVTPR